MNVKKFALFGGLVMLIMGVAALIFPGPIEGLPLLKLQDSYGLFLGLFPMNIVNKVALILFGVAGIWASQAKFTSLPASIRFSRAVCFVMGAAAILGLFPQTNTLNGYWPLFDGEVFAHAVFAAFGAYYGFALTTKAAEKNKVLEQQKPAHGL